MPVEAEVGTRAGSEMGSGSGWQRMHSRGTRGREDGCSWVWVRDGISWDGVKCETEKGKEGC